MSDDLLNVRKSEPNIRHFNSDPQIYRDDKFDQFLKMLQMTRGKAVEILNKTTDSDLGVSLIEDSVMDISKCASEIVKRVLRIPRCAFCPFCCDDFVFDFTFKEHLKKRHFREISELVEHKQTVTDAYEIHQCPYCPAIFYHYVLIPLHLGRHHDVSDLREWQSQRGNMDELKLQAPKCPSIDILSASTGVSEMFHSLDMSDRGEKNKSPRPKSILKKKSNYSGKIIFSPSSASLRRMTSDIEKRNASVRRQLRFDLPPEEFLYEFSIAAEKPTLYESIEFDGDIGCFGKSEKKIITSTPNNSMDAKNFGPKRSFTQRVFPRKVRKILFCGF